MVDLTPVREANRKVAQSLLDRIPPVITASGPKTGPKNLRWMMERVIQEIETFPLDKIGRWIGFVQGVLALSNHLDVDEERNMTRENYQAAYRLEGLTVPLTMQMEDGDSNAERIGKLYGIDRENGETDNALKDRIVKAISEPPKETFLETAEKMDRFFHHP